MLVGGEGTRLRPLTYSTPKPLLPIVNRPFLDRQLERLAACGVDEVVLSMGYLPDAFERHFPDNVFVAGDRGEVKVSYAVEDEPLGTAGAIAFAGRGSTERVVVCNGDVLTTLDVAALVRFHDERNAAATIHLCRVDDPSAFGVVPTRPDGAVEAFVEKPPAETAPSHWINAGTYVLEPEVLEGIPAGQNMSIEREVFPKLAQRGAVYAMQTDDYWLDIGTPASYLRAHADVLAGDLGVPPTSDVHEAAAGVWIGDDVALDGATVEAPSVIGAGSRVAPGVRVRASVLGRGCTLGQGAVVEGSVLLDGARVAEGARVEGSVLGPGAVVEADADVGDESIVGAGAVVVSGVEMRRARVHVPPRP